MGYWVFTFRIVTSIDEFWWFWFLSVFDYWWFWFLRVLAIWGKTQKQIKPDSQKILSVVAKVMEFSDTIAVAWKEIDDGTFRFQSHDASRPLTRTSEPLKLVVTKTMDFRDGYILSRIRSLFKGKYPRSLETIVIASYENGFACVRIITKRLIFTHESDPDDVLRTVRETIVREMDVLMRVTGDTFADATGYNVILECIHDTTEAVETSPINIPFSNVDHLGVSRPDGAALEPQFVFMYSRGPRWDHYYKSDGIYDAFVSEFLHNQPKFRGAPRLD